MIKNADRYNKCFIMTNMQFLAFLLFELLFIKEMLKTRTNGCRGRLYKSNRPMNESYNAFIKLYNTLNRRPA